MLRNQLEQYHIVLASQSPRRKELLGRLHIPFSVLPAKREEIIQDGPPEIVVMDLAKQKAAEIYDLKRDDDREKARFIIAADTIVVFAGQILGKPRDREHAYEMLRMLSGTTHQVYTGVCLIREDVGSEAVEHCFYEKTDVRFARLTEEEIWDYIDSGDPFDKAGGYGIQGDFAVYVREIQGDYNNVVGLPVARLYQEMKGMMDAVS